MLVGSKRIERNNFSGRFVEALNRAGYNSSSATSVWREFNIRYTETPVTVHAVRKWLLGEAIPSQEKMRVLASWLSVSPGWLRFGGGTMSVVNGNTIFVYPSASMINDLQSLDTEHRIAAKEMLSTLVKLNMLRHK